MTSPKSNDFVFFGTDEFARAMLETLTALNCSPILIVTTPDAPTGRGHKLKPPVVKVWAEARHIPYLQPKNLRSDLETSLRSDLVRKKLFLVASYGKILPPEILSLPHRGVLNIHPSLLPKYRGPTPIQSAILAGETETGITIMLVDEKVDHGPILQTKSLKLEAKSFIQARDQLAKIGAQLFVEILPDWLAGKIVPRPQDHSQATDTKKFKKTDGLIDLTDDSLINYRKFLALNPWPGTYCFLNHQRLIITGAEFANGQFIITRVKPAGRREMPYADFQRGIKNHIYFRQS
ncbi:MAG: methionyl-tRNA formyltransferase [Candidatus Vogelbacteria bacterium]|nr:methionyl-tRNA formyltransferase [Candidatus Vogelbacteria bacterium]